VTAEKNEQRNGLDERGVDIPLRVFINVRTAFSEAESLLTSLYSDVKEFQHWDKLFSRRSDIYKVKVEDAVRKYNEGYVKADCAFDWRLWTRAQRDEIRESQAAVEALLLKLGLHQQVQDGSILEPTVEILRLRGKHIWNRDGSSAIRRVRDFDAFTSRSRPDHRTETEPVRGSSPLVEETTRTTPAEKRSSTHRETAARTTAPGEDDERLSPSPSKIRRRLWKDSRRSQRLSSSESESDSSDQSLTSPCSARTAKSERRDSKNPERSTSASKKIA